MDKELEKILKNIIKKKINYKLNNKLVADGYLDSFSIILLVSQLEQSFKVKIKLSNININVFNSLKSIKKMLIQNGAKSK